MENHYARFNKLYWDNRLPKDVPVGWCENLREGDAIACTVAAYDEITEHTAFLIYLDPTFREYNKLSKFNLLHEMCHVALHPYHQHGKKFDEEMLRIAQRGAFSHLW